MADNIPPKTITEIYYMIDKRFALMAAAQITHDIEHKFLGKILDDHEARIRSGMTFTSIMVGAGSLFSLIAIIKSFLP